MFIKLFLIFTIVPALELGLLIYAGNKIGLLNTIAIVILTAIVGSFMVRQEGMNVAYRFRLNLENGVFPSEEIMDGAMVLVAGALLLTPGFFTDIIGLLMVIPSSRDIIKNVIKRYIKKNFTLVGPGGNTYGP